MCEPTTLLAVSLALGAVSTGASLYGQNQQKQMQEAANETQYNNTLTAYRGNLANIEVQRNQMAQDASEQINANNKAAAIAKATATTSAGEAGVSGTSVDALLRDLGGAAGYDNTNVEANYLRQNDALNVQRNNVYNSTASSINSLRAPTMPDYLGGVLRFAQTGVSAYAQNRQTEAIIAGQKR